MKVDRKEYPHEAKSSDPGEKLYYSDLMICESAAGHYIGRMGYVENAQGYGYVEPYSRESGYYPSREAAFKSLRSGKFDRGAGGAEIAFARSEGNLPPPSEQYAYGPPRFRPGFQQLQRIIYVELPHGLDIANGHGILFVADDMIKAVLEGYQRACPEGTKFSLDERAWSNVVREEEQCTHAIRHLDNSCGAKVCVVCSDHEGLDRCFCGWARDGGDGKQQLIELGETIEEE